MNKILKLKIIMAIMLTLVVCFEVSSTVANEGPHGYYTKVTDKCAYCHRAHTAGLNKLLKQGPNIADFCFTCHKNGLGANNNVYGGYFMGWAGPNNLGTTTDVTTNPWPGEPTNTSNLGVANAGLNGGGFVTAAPFKSFSRRCADTACTTNSVVPVTSIHNALDDTSTYTMWASGNSGPGAVVNITCVSCHNPHGTQNYRLLRSTGAPKDPFLNPNPWPASSNAVGLVKSWETEFGGTQTKDYTTHKYKTTFSKFCTACHKQYVVDLGTEQFISGTYDVNLRGTYDAGDGAGSIVRYKHPIDIPIASWDFYGTKNIAQNLASNDRLPLSQPNAFSAVPTTSDVLTCLTCHQPHGTASTVADRIKNWPLPTKNTTGSAPGYSNLKRLDNRGECEDCHGW